MITINFTVEEYKLLRQATEKFADYVEENSDEELHDKIVDLNEKVWGAN